MNQLQPAIDRVLRLSAVRFGRANPGELDRYATRLADTAEHSTDPERRRELATLAYVHRAAAAQARAAAPPRAHWWSWQH